jgi:hypothetical protein
MSLPVGGLLLNCLGQLVVLLICVGLLVACCWSVVDTSLPVGGLLLNCLGLLVVCC